MSEKEFEKYLKSIGGLVDGHRSDRDNIFNAYFFEINKGWYKLVKDLIDELIENGWDKQVLQVKEKFGGLRFYINATDENHYKIISKYEEMSVEICEVCGENGSLRGGGWLRTLCAKHYIEPILSGFKTKHEEGYTDSEIKNLLGKFKKFNFEKYNESMFGNTCSIVDGESVNYHTDIRRAVYAGVEGFKEEKIK